MYRSKVCVQEFSYFVSGLDIQLEKSEYNRPVRKKSVAGGEIRRVHVLFFLRNRYEPMAQWLRLVAESRATWVRFLKSAETLCSASAILRGTEPVSALTRALFTLSRSLWFFSSWILSVTISRWQTIWLPLIWRAWTRALASNRPHVLAWHIGRDYCDCRASELTDRQVNGFVFSWFLENTENTKASQETFLRLMPWAGWGLKNPHCGPLFSSIFHNSRKNNGQALLWFLLWSTTIAIITPVRLCWDKLLKLIQ